MAAKIASAYTPGLKRCYRQRLAQDPSARGTLALALTVGETGRVKLAKARGLEASVAACVEQQMATWRFPVPKDGEAEPVTASFELELALTP